MSANSSRQVKTLENHPNQSGLKPRLFFGKNSIDCNGIVVVRPPEVRKFDFAATGGFAIMMDTIRVTFTLQPAGGVEVNHARVEIATSSDEKYLL
jgi:hypothetical protein